MPPYFALGLMFQEVHAVALYPRSLQHLRRPYRALRIFFVLEEGEYVALRRGFAQDRKIAGVLILLVRNGTTACIPAGESHRQQGCDDRP